MKYLIIIFFLVLTGVVFSQSPLSNELSEDFDEEYIDADSVDYESYTKKTSSFKALFNGKPGRAILYGILIPGGGQFYNKDYWKVPIVWAAEGAGIATFIYLRGQYRGFDEAYRLTVNGDSDANFRGVTGVQALYNWRQRFQKFSEQAGVGMVVIHIIMAVESYIDRHLSIFDIDEDLSINYSAPGINNSTQLAGLSFNYSF